MHESPPDPPSWRRPLDWVKEHMKEEIGAAIAGLFLWNYGSRLWDWLLENIQAYPAQILCVIALGTTTTFVVLWGQALKTVKIAMEVASERSLKAEDLEEALSEKEQRLTSLEEESATLRKPTDPLAFQQRQIVTCILCADKITISKLARFIGMQPATVGGEIVKLRWTPQFVRCCGYSNGEELFELTVDGKQYAIDQGIKVIHQSEEEIPQTADAAAEMKALKEQNDMLFQQNHADKARIGDLEEVIGMTRGIVESLARLDQQPSTVSAFRPIRDAQAAARRTKLIELLQKVSHDKNFPPFITTTKPSKDTDKK